ncbi:endonuclease/exonuclease/phosphatase family protein [Geopseudomonas aromaticivorans]
MSMLNRTVFGGALLAVTLLASSVAAASDIVVASWNAKRLGHGGEQSYPALAAIGSKADLLAVQEVMTEQGLAKLETALEKHTGESWSTLASHAIGSNSYKEMYAFVWRDKTVAYEEGAVVYLDRGNRFIREPFSAKFMSLRDGSSLALGTVHILYGDGVSDRTPEIRALADYWTWMAEVYPGTPQMLVGDFNLPPSDAAWAPLKQYAKPLITSGGTTLSGKDSKFASLYDNLWISKNSPLKIASSGVINYPKIIGWSHEKSRKHVSDHAPVYAALGRARLDASTITVSGGPVAAAPAAPRVAVQRQQVSQTSAASAEGVRGNRNSQIFHYPRCPSYNQISPKNQVEFRSAAEAQAAGYRQAGNCR